MNFSTEKWLGGFEIQPVPSLKTKIIRMEIVLS